jgi:hypothetical protein
MPTSPASSLADRGRATSSSNRRMRSGSARARLPWQRPAPAGRLTPARVRRGFRAVHGALPALTAAPKPGKPGPGRPPGSRNRRPAARHDVGKTTTKKATQKTTLGQTG